MRWANRDKDSGDSVLVTAVIGITLIAVIFAVLTNITMSVVDKGEYESINQHATQGAVKSLRPNGSIGGQSVAAYLKSLDKRIEADVASNVLHEDSGCTTVEVGDVKKASPYVEIYIGERRGKGHGEQKLFNSKKFVFEGREAIKAGASNPNDLEMQIPLQDKNHVIESVLYVASPNPLGFGGVNPCSQFRVFSSAIAFGTNQDLR